MRNPDDFDTFYKDTRDRLLLQTFALTGDLPASRNAVRDAYVAAWHHWRKVERQPSRDAWLRPHAWSDAQRRHTARIWHRDKTIDPECRATLEALAKLTHQQRRVLLLNHLSATPMPDLAREVGLTQQSAERVLQAATSRYAVHRGAASTQIHAQLTGLSSACSDARFPRPSIIRRAGAARRRTFTAVGILASLATLAGAGMFVTDHKGVAPSLSAEQMVGTGVEKPEPEPARLAEAELLTAEQAARLSPTQVWHAGVAGPNTDGDGLYTRCQGSRFADPKGTQTLVRTFHSDETGRRPEVLAVQATELSRNAASAKEAYAEAVGWYAGCTAPHTQLLATYAVPGVGDQASVFLLRTWGRKPGTLAVGVARTSRITTTTARIAPGAKRPELEPVASLLAAAVNRICGTPGAGTCAAPPRLTELPPQAIGDVPGLLDVVDFPQAGSVRASWTATEPRRATQNLATIACDDSDFSQDPVSNGMTRSFLVLGARMPKRFGVTETVGTLPTPRAARRFVGVVHKRMGTCEDHDLASTVEPMFDETGRRIQYAAWHITTEVNDDDTIDFLMAIVRRGDAVAQIGFVTAKGATFDRRTFRALAERAIERLRYMPEPKNS